MKNNFFSYKFISYLVKNVDSVENVNRFIVYKIVSVNLIRMDCFPPLCSVFLILQMQE